MNGEQNKGWEEARKGKKETDEQARILSCHYQKLNSV